MRLLLQGYKGDKMRLSKHTNTTQAISRPLWGLLWALLLLAAALRLQYVVDFPEWVDEIWSLWHVRDSLESVITRTPYDWTPLFGVITWFWVRIAGPTLEAARILQVLLSLLTLAFLYRAAYLFPVFIAHKWHITPTQRHRFALMVWLVYIVQGFVIFTSVDYRAYGLLLLLGAIALWLTLRWIQRPSWQTSVGLMVTIAALLYTSYTSLPFIAFFTLMVLVLRPRRFGQWVGIGMGVAVLILPLVPRFLNSAEGRLSLMAQPPPPVLEGLQQIYSAFGGSVYFVALLIAAAVLMLILLIRQRYRWRMVGLLIAWVLAPLAIYITQNGALLQPRYVWWVALGLAFFVAYASLIAPRLSLIGVMLAAIGLLTVPINYDDYRWQPTDAVPFRHLLAQFEQHLRPGDVIIRDPYCQCGSEIGWDYFVPHYFPSGYLPVAQTPDEARRVWYMYTQGWQQDEALRQQIEQGRVASTFFGPWFSFVQLYEAPPEPDGVTFGDQLILQGVEWANNRRVYAEDEPVTVRLWWSAAQPLPHDYSMSLALFRSGQLVAQVDGPPHTTATQTSTWSPGTHYVDTFTLMPPAEQGVFPNGIYDLKITVYQWWDGQRLIPETNTLWPVDEAGYIDVGEVQIYAW